MRASGLTDWISPDDLSLPSCCISRAQRPLLCFGPGIFLRSFSTPLHLDSSTFLNMAIDFGNVKSDQGVQKLDAHMATHSYVEGYALSSADVDIFGKMITCPNSSKYPHGARWYRLVGSYSESERLWILNASKSVANKSCDDVDLFGDEAVADVSAVLKKKREEVAVAKKEKKVVIAKSSVTLEAMPYDADKPITHLFESAIKHIKIDGLIWGVPFSIVNGPFGLKGLSFGCVVEDDKVKTDDIEEAVETIGMSPDDKQKYIDLRRNGDLEDYEDEWPGKLIGTVKVTSFQKI